MRRLRRTVVAVGLFGGVLAFVAAFALVLAALSAPAQGHSGSPSPTTWSNGQTLTSTALNDTIAHLHNTFTAGITNAHISTSAGIAHSKLATPALVPKAWAYIGGPCDCGAAAGTSCTLTESSRVASVKSTGTAGVCNVTLDYTPSDIDFAVICSSNGTGVGIICNTLSYATGAGPHFQLRLVTDASALTNAIFQFAVFDAEN